MIYENVVFPDLVVFECKRCGFCCRNEPPDINLKEQQKIEAKGFTNFLETLDGIGDKNIRRKKDGSCFFVNKDNICQIEDAKPLICRLEPFIIVDYNDEANKIFLELNPLAVTTCKGISTGEMKKPEEIAKTAQIIIKDIQEIISNKTGLLPADKKVAALTRKLLKELNSNETK